MPDKRSRVGGAGVGLGVRDMVLPYHNFGLFPGELSFGHLLFVTYELHNLYNARRRSVIVHIDPYRAPEAAIIAAGRIAARWASCCCCCALDGDHGLDHFVLPIMLFVLVSLSL